MARRTKQENALHAANLRSERVFKSPVTRWMNQQPDLVLDSFDKVRNTRAIKVSDVEKVVNSFGAWKIISANGTKILTPPTTTATTMGTNITVKLMTGVTDDPLKRLAADSVERIASKLIVQVTDGTKEAINVIIKRGIENGKGWKAIGRELRPLVGLNSRNLQTLANFEENLLITRPELSPKQVTSRVDAKARQLHRARNETIARTEAKRAMSEGQRQTFGQAGIKTLIWFALFDHDEECAEVNGNEFSIAEAEGAQPLHPR